jgi:hypothetical protein
MFQESAQFIVKPAVDPCHPGHPGRAAGICNHLHSGGGQTKFQQLFSTQGRASVMMTLEVS